MWVDAGHAGCLRSRKGTTGTIWLLGKCTIRNTCKSQAVVALSSGEAEYYVLVPGTCQAPGEQSLLADWNMLVSHAIWTQQQVLAIGSRHGLGKVKHVDTVFLWTQQQVLSGKFKLAKRSTLDML